MGKIVEKHGKDWHHQLPYALWAYRKSIRMKISVTPFPLIYGDKVAVPLELEIPLLRVSLEGMISNEDRRKVRLSSL